MVILNGAVTQKPEKMVILNGAMHRKKYKFVLYVWLLQILYNKSNYIDGQFNAVEFSLMGDFLSGGQILQVFKNY